ncbi:MAG: hypothetical protein A4E49_02894 [Methanosaeta sp. PtaU1.Bin112]|nr:MAG: hypothetical protein A4E49_02894 [Methanosaeta sp. PtaU1.Bin112]
MLHRLAHVGMNTLESDIDLVIIYIAPTLSLLRGERILPTVRQRIAAHRGEIYDTLGWEIGHLINQLIKGNVNAIWYAMSPPGFQAWSSSLQLFKRFYRLSSRPTCSNS